MNEMSYDIVCTADGKYWSYKYRNVSNPNEKYTKIYTEGTSWLDSYVTFKPVNLPGAPEMVVYTYCGRWGNRSILLPRSVGKWEIKYYGSYQFLSHPDQDYLKNAGVVNLNEYFGNYVKSWLILELSGTQKIYTVDHSKLSYSIPGVK